MDPIVYDLQFSQDQLDRMSALVHQIVDDDENYPKKIRGENFYKKLSPELKSLVNSILASRPEAAHLNWHYEVFLSKEPVGMHNDRNYFPANKELCERGFIIPIEWSGETPKTRFFDLFINKKVNWDGRGHFRTLEKECVPHEPRCLEIFQSLSWKTNSLIIFDGQQIHDASDFRINPGDYKLSINGLGYSVQETFEN